MALSVRALRRQPRDAQGIVTANTVDFAIEQTSRFPQIHRRFRHDVKQRFAAARADAMLMANGFADISPPQTPKIAGVSAGEKFRE